MIRQRGYLILWFLIAAILVGWLVAKCAYAEGLSFGIGLVNPHSESSRYHMDLGGALHLTYEKEVNDWLDGGATYLYSRYTEVDNDNGKTDKINAHVGFVYLKPALHFKEVSTFFQFGPGFNITDSTSGPCFVVGPGIGYKIYEAWKVEVTYLLLMEHDHIYRMPTLSVRWEF